MAIEERLAGFLKAARDWERKATNFPGVFLLKLPSSRTRQSAVAIEVNPVGSATKKRGIVIRSASELSEFNRIVTNQKLVVMNNAIRSQADYPIYAICIMRHHIKYRTSTTQLASKCSRICH